MAADMMFADNEVLDFDGFNPDVADEDFGGFDDLDSLSSDVDRWGEDSFEDDRNFIVGLLR